MVGYRHTYPWQLATRRKALALSCRLAADRIYDADILAEELRRILTRYDAVAHYGIYHRGGWGGISLLAVDGDPSELRPLKGTTEKTPALHLAPYMERIIDGFDCTKDRVRLMRLAPGEQIFWHYDLDETADDGTKARVHIPIRTNPRVQFQISHEDLFWRPGELWYGDFSFPHRVANFGEEPRFHLIVDLRLNDFVRNLFPEGFLDRKPDRLAVKPFCQATCGVLTMSLARKVPRAVRQGELLAASRRLITRRLAKRRTAKP
ncbi:MAG: aspartyl/asparaginyl beta-hydroxylase domain-containing protein [Dongiaceae bacterium]